MSSGDRRRKSTSDAQASGRSAASVSVHEAHAAGSMHDSLLHGSSKLEARFRRRAIAAGCTTARVTARHQDSGELQETAGRYRVFIVRVSLCYMLFVLVAERDDVFILQSSICYIFLILIAEHQEPFVFGPLLCYIISVLFAERLFPLFFDSRFAAFFSSQSLNPSIVQHSSLTESR